MISQSSQCGEGAEPHIRLPSLESRKGTRNPQGTWLWRAAGLDCRTFTGLGERVSTPRGRTPNPVCTRTQGKGAGTPQETEADLPASAGGSPAQAWVGSRSLWGWGHQQQQSRELPLGSNPPCGHETGHYKTPRGEHRKSSDVNCSNAFFNPSPRIMEIKTKIDKYNLTKLKSFCTAKKTINKTKKTTLRLGENICKWCDWQGVSL